ncbi:RHOMBOID-like protein 3 [Vicia villosa]|uniref:RHOMBOID-like protein 3 n=1 Tax=Vicia villosa TaxID=3911 RepID=UPI00273A88A2|nr:RHOMBOID-like protein 3 [Vicia villosa]
MDASNVMINASTKELYVDVVIHFRKVCEKYHALLKYVESTSLDQVKEKIVCALTDQEWLKEVNASNLAMGILPYVDNFAHIGGFATGLLLGFILLPHPQCGWLEQRSLPAGIRLKSKFKAYQYILGIVSLILLIVGFSIGLVMLFKEENGHDHCHWCHYLTCVPSVWECNN